MGQCALPDEGRLCSPPHRRARDRPLTCGFATHLPCAIMIRLKFAIDLNYEIADNPADFIFNIHAAQTPWQSVFAEAVTLGQSVETAIYTDPTFGSRYMRLRARPGPLTVHYDAT